MAPADRIHVYVGEPLRRLLDQRSGDLSESASRTLNTVADRYQALVARSLPEMSEAEWMACADALNGVALWHEAAAPSFVWAEIEDADRLNGLGAKWGIDAEALVRLLRAAPYATLVAVVDVVERLWADPQADWATQLREWGALPDDSVPRTGESTEPLGDDQVATVVELVRTGRREDYDALCAALGVLNAPALWTGLQDRVRRTNAQD